MAITKPPTGTVGWDDEVNAVIDRVNDMDTIGHYPLSAYGMHSASSNPDNTTLVPFAWILEAKLVLNDDLMKRGAEARAARIEHDQPSEFGED